MTPTFPTIPTVLAELTRERLHDLGRVFGIHLRSGREPKQTAVHALAGRLRGKDLPAVLRELGRDELRAVCRAHSLEAEERSREALIGRICTQANIDPKAPIAEIASRHQNGVPRAGQILAARGRQWLVEKVVAPDPTHSALLHLACLDDDAPGRELELLWDLEIGARVVSPESEGLGRPEALDPPAHFGAYLHALKWSAVSAADATRFQAPFRAGIKLMAHQLTPLMKALELPRANLFIADDVGLGKTIEAGLVLQELILRQQAGFVLIVCPASLCLQWRDEMTRRFGLRFEVMTRQLVARRRVERGGDGRSGREAASSRSSRSMLRNGACLSNVSLHGDVMVRKKPDPIEATIERALMPGRFVEYKSSWDFVERLERVEEQISGIVKEEPTRAVGLLETFIAACYEKAEEIDDSSGLLGQFVEDLFCLWIKARQAAKDDFRETAEQLLGWMDDDNYGFCYGIERQAVKAFNKTGLKAFASVVREEWAAELAQVRKREKGDKMASGASRFRQLSDVLLAIYIAQRDPDLYLSVAEEVGLSPRDCAAVAEIHDKRKNSAEALKWVERGLAIQKREGDEGSGSSDSLEDLQRKLLKKSGREEDALDSAWKDFEKQPSADTYRTLMKYVPRGERAKWHEKALVSVPRAGVSDAIELYVALKEWDRLAERVRKTNARALERLSHYTTEPAARKLAKPHPDAAAKLFQAMALRILAAKKSKYYDAALENLDCARGCFEKAGQEEKWKDLVGKVRDEHSRKFGFMPQFEALVSPESLPKEQAFLEKVENRKARRFRKR